MEQKLRIFAQGVVEAAGESAVFETVRSDHLKQVAVKVRCSKVGEASDYVFVNSSNQEVSVPENGALKKVHYLGDVFRCEVAQTDYQPEDAAEDYLDTIDDILSEDGSGELKTEGDTSKEQADSDTDETEDLKDSNGNEDNDYQGEGADGAEDDLEDTSNQEGFPQGNDNENFLNLPEGSSAPAETPESLEKDEVKAQTESTVAKNQEQRGGKKNKSRK